MRFKKVIKYHLFIFIEICEMCEKICSGEATGKSKIEQLLVSETRFILVITTKSERRPPRGLLPRLQDHHCGHAGRLRLDHAPLRPPPASLPQLLLRLHALSVLAVHGQHQQHEVTEYTCWKELGHICSFVS